MAIGVTKVNGDTGGLNNVGDGRILTNAAISFLLLKDILIEKNKFDFLLLRMRKLATSK